MNPAGRAEREERSGEDGRSVWEQRSRQEPLPGSGGRPEPADLTPASTPGTWAAPPRGAHPVEPRLSLPILPLITASVGGALAVGAAVTLIGWVIGRGGPFTMAGAAAGGVVALASVLSTVASVPWIPKPASTAMLAWLAGSMLRMLLTATGAFLVYSAPPSGWLPGLNEARAPFLLAVATAYLTGLLVEVGVVARIVGRSRPV